MQHLCVARYGVCITVCNSLAMWLEAQLYYVVNSYVFLVVLRPVYLYLISLMRLAQMCEPLRFFYYAPTCLIKDFRSCMIHFKRFEMADRKG